MNIDALIDEWGNYERKRIENGSGFPKQTVIAAWAESQSHGGFGSRWPTGIQYKNLNNSVVKTRLAVDDLQDKYRNVIIYRYVYNGTMTEILCKYYLNISRNTAYKRLGIGKKLISLYLSNN